jgi:carboxyl-terminal processing protease
MNLVQTATVLATLALASGAQAQFTKHEQNAIKVVTTTLSKGHIGKPVFDREFSERWLQTFLTELDPSKMYFLSADIAEFKQHERKISDLVSGKNIALLQLANKRFKSRAAEALNQAILRLDDSFNFTIFEEITLKYGDWPTSDDARIDRWRRQLKYDLLVEKLNPAENLKPITFLKARYKSILQKTSKLTDEKALGLYLDSFCKTIDPHSGYWTPSEFQSFFGTGKFRTYSIGLHLKIVDGRAMVHGIAPKFRNVESSEKLQGCELLAIRTNKGDIHNLREIDMLTTSRLIQYGLGKTGIVTLELYDEPNMDRFSVSWPRVDG